MGEEESNNQLQYYICDLETSGLDVKRQDIVEFSIIRCSDRLQLSRTIKAKNPKNASADALRITGKTYQDLFNGVDQLDAVNDVDKFLASDGLTPEHRCIVGHNIISFDKRFIHHLWDQYERPFGATYWLDTIPLSKRLAIKMGQPKAKMKLDAVVQLFGLKKISGAHTARGDSRATYYLWKHLMDNDVDYLDLIKPFPHRQEEIEDMNELMEEENA